MLPIVLQTSNFAVSIKHRGSFILTPGFGDRTAGKNAEILEKERTQIGKAAGGGEGAGDADPRVEGLQGV